MKQTCHWCSTNLIKHNGYQPHTLSPYIFCSYNCVRLQEKENKMGLRKDGFTFEPWNNEEIQKRKPFASVTDIVNSPPCTKCKFWNPVTDGTEALEHRGVTLCHKENMHHDFSCFEADE